jgi:multidrug efflux system membrane fusion protein
VHRSNPVNTAIATGLLLVIAGCAKPTDRPAAPRPVMVSTVGIGSDSASLVLAGDVRARYETRVSFRVGGKILRRLVNVGDRVHAGSVIAELDEADLKLAADSQAAQLAAIRTEYEFAREDRARHADLLAQKLISPVDLERRDTAVSGLRDRIAAATAQLQQARNQAGYARLVADHDAVVVALSAEAGQVVATGQPVAVLARPDSLEVAIDVPEQYRTDIARAGTVEVSLWSHPEMRFTGRVREVSASADPASRSYPTRIQLAEPPQWLNMGMSAAVRVAAAVRSASIAIPMSAVFQPQAQAGGAARVWTLSAAGDAVSSVPVVLGAPAAGDRVYVKGLVEGQRIVTAGASLLREGQAVRVLQPADLGAPPAARSASGAG